MDSKSNSNVFKLYYVQDVLCPFCYLTDKLQIDQLERFKIVPIPMKMIPKDMDQSDFFMEKDSEIVRNFIPSYNKPKFKGKYESETASIISYGLPEEIRYKFLKEVRRRVFENGERPGDLEVLKDVLESINSPITNVETLINDENKNKYEHSMSVVQRGQISGIPMFILEGFPQVKLVGYKPNLKEILDWVLEKELPKNVVLI